jgi:hypothetical protein
LTGKPDIVHVGQITEFVKLTLFLKTYLKGDLDPSSQTVGYSLDATTFSITTFSLTTFSIMSLSLKGFYVTLSINDIQHK